MTSFFIPQLGNQIYAMAGMQTRLHLMADEPGTYAGQNQQFSGRVAGVGPGGLYHRDNAVCRWRIDALPGISNRRLDWRLVCHCALEQPRSHS